MSWFTRCAVGAIVLGVVAAIWGFGVEPGLLTTREITIESKKWPENRPPFRISVIADLHIGAPHANLEKVDEVVARSNTLEPDLVVLLGDYVVLGVLGGDFTPPEPIARRLKALRARHGAVAILGNHDWWFDGERVRRAIEAVGIPVLENEALAVETTAGPLWIAGLADDMTRSPDVPRAMAQVTDDNPVVMLSHDPAPFAEVTDRPVITLAGHTHGGQVYLPWIGALFIPGRAPLRWAYGHIQEMGKDMYVSAGIGTTILPIRLNMPPEIALITIRAPGPQ